MNLSFLTLPGTCIRGKQARSRRCVLIIIADRVVSTLASSMRLCGLVFVDGVYGCGDTMAGPIIKFNGRIRRLPLGFIVVVWKRLKTKFGRVVGIGIFGRNQVSLLDDRGERIWGREARFCWGMLLIIAGCFDPALAP